jgi:hypothetical protein
MKPLLALTLAANSAACTTPHDLATATRRRFDPVAECGATPVLVTWSRVRPTYPGLALEREAARDDVPPERVKHVDRVDGVVHYGVLLDVGYATSGAASADLERVLRALVTEGAPVPSGSDPWERPATTPRPPTSAPGVK